MKARFRRKRAANPQQENNGLADKKATTLPMLELDLPTHEFRTSLILPHLTQRFALLRNEKGDLLSYPEFSNALRAQRETGKLSEHEERNILEQYRLQSSKENGVLSEPPATALYTTNSWQMSSDTLASPSMNDIANSSVPGTLEDFHRQRARHQGNSKSMFGHDTGEPEMKRSTSGNVFLKSSRSRSRIASPSSEEASPVLHYSSSYSKLTESSADEDDEEDDVEPLPAKSANLDVQMTKSQIRRISRVLDEMELEFSTNYTSLLAKTAQNDQSHYEDTFAGSSDSLDKSTSTSGPSPTKGSSRSRAIDEDTEAIDPGRDHSLLRRPFQPNPRSLSPVPSVPALDNSRDSAALSVVHSALFPPANGSTSPSASMHDSATERDANTPVPLTPMDPDTPRDDQQDLPTSASMIAAPSESPTMSSLANIRPGFYEYQDEDTPSITWKRDSELDGEASDGQEGSDGGAMSWERGSLGEADPSEATHSTEETGFHSRRHVSSTSITSLGSSYRTNESDLDEEDVLMQKKPAEIEQLNKSLDLDLQEALGADPMALGGLHIQDVAFMQQELVRSASQRAQAALQRGIGNATMSSRRPAAREQQEAPEQQGTPLFASSADTTPDQSYKQEELATPEVEVADLGHIQSQPKAFEMARSASASPVQTFGERPSLRPAMSISELRGMHKAKADDAVPRHTPFHPNSDDFLPGSSSTPSPQTQAPLIPRSPPSNRPYANTQSVLLRSVSDQAEAATVALKGTATSSDSPPSRSILSRRKSSKSLSTKNISTPQLLSSSADLSRLQHLATIHPLPDSPEVARRGGKHDRADSGPDGKSKTHRQREATEQSMINLGLLDAAPRPTGSSTEMITPPMQQSARFSPPQTPATPSSPPPIPRSNSRQDQNEGSEKGLNRLLSRLRRRKPSTSGAFPEPIPYLPFNLGSPREPSSPPPQATRAQSPVTRRAKSPPERAQSPELSHARHPSVTIPTTPASYRKPPRPISPPPAHLVEEASVPLPEQTETPRSPSAAGRAPISYDVSATWRKRSLSVSESSRSRTNSPMPSNYATSFSTPTSPSTKPNPMPSPPLAELSAAMQRSTTEPLRDSIQQLMHAGLSLGIDTNKLNDLVNQASQRNSQSSSAQCDSIPEEEEEATRDLSRKLVRRTIIFPSSALSESGVSPVAMDVDRRSRAESGESRGYFNQSNIADVLQEAGVIEPENEEEESEAREDPAEMVSFRSVDGRAPTPPPTQLRHSRRASQDVLEAEPVPNLPMPPAINRRPIEPLHITKQSSMSGSTISPTSGTFLLPSNTRESFRPHTTKSSYADSVLDFYNRGDDTEEFIVAQGRVPAAAESPASPLSQESSGKSEEGDPNIPSTEPGDRVEVDEMGDGSLVWSVVRNLRHQSGRQSIVSAEFNFHSRNTSIDSTFVAPLKTHKPTRSNDPLRLLVKGHQRKYSREEGGVGGLGYIPSPSPPSDPASARTQYRARADSIQEEIVAYSADDGVVSQLIEDITKGMDKGSFNLVRAQSITRLNRARAEREAAKLQQSQVQALDFDKWSQ